MNYQQEIQQLKLVSVFATASSMKSLLQMMCGQASGPKVYGLQWRTSDQKWL